MFTLFAPAKINLALDVLYKRPDGYHEIDSVMQTISLADQLTFENSDTIELSTNVKNLPVDQGNLAWKAVNLLLQETGINKGIKIHITKKIPIAAGLAGGSTDAAGVLIALNHLWGLGLSIDELMLLGVKLGADVPFCIQKGTARARGIGENLTGINSNLKCNLLVVTPNINVSTALAYSKIQPESITRRPQMEEVITALETGNIQELSHNWGNVFEETVLADYPEVVKVKNILNKFGLNINLMSGSGPTVFALNPPTNMVKQFLRELPSEWFGCLAYFL